MGSQDRLLVCVMHHIISDDWSIDIFIRELVTLYNAYTQGVSSPLKGVPIQYADFALWQRYCLTDEVLYAQLQFWKRKLADVPQVLTLPSDRVRTAAQTFRGHHYRFTILPNLTRRLREVATESGATVERGTWLLALPLLLDPVEKLSLQSVSLSIHWCCGSIYLEIRPS